VTRFPYSVVFIITKDGRHCDIYCHQVEPTEHFTLELIDNALVLPDEVVIQQHANQQFMRLPSEYAEF